MVLEVLPLVYKKRHTEQQILCTHEHDWGLLGAAAGFEQNFRTPS